MDNYEITKVLDIHYKKHKMEKRQALKKASEVPVSLGTDTCGVQHLSENSFLSKGRVRFKGRIGG